jgi:hypothetical protein
MSSYCGTYGQFRVESDSYGWPIFFADLHKRELITKKVEEILKTHGPLGLNEIYQILKRETGWNLGATWDGIYAVIERAARSVAEPVWKVRN